MLWLQPIFFYKIGEIYYLLVRFWDENFGFYVYNSLSLKISGVVRDNQPTNSFLNYLLPYIFLILAYSSVKDLPSIISWLQMTKGYFLQCRDVMEAPLSLVKMRISGKHQLLLFIITIVLLWGRNTLDLEYKSKWSDLILACSF